jgi:hypothetical protein
VGLWAADSTNPFHAQKEQGIDVSQSESIKVPLRECSTRSRLQVLLEFRGMCFV